MSVQTWACLQQQKLCAKKGYTWSNACVKNISAKKMCVQKMGVFAKKQRSNFKKGAFATTTKGGGVCKKYVC